MSSDTTCVILKTTAGGKDEFRVRIVQNAEEVDAGDVTNLESVERFFGFVGFYFCKITDEHYISNYIASNFIDTPVTKTRVAQAVGALLRRKGSLPVFNSKQDASVEAERLEKEFLEDLGLSVEYGTIMVDYSKSAAMENA